ncbi:MAG TPA: FtsW/RodA/SpoVE family cell cycle protein, partial [Candidatus Fermentibacter sp.]|nr:FtsW/RodA/SpoVE family cell cycle protein [Candidatus Fermentibacter sp.]
MTAAKTDRVMLAALAAILVCGLLAVYSASRAVPGESIFVKQVFWVAIGVLTFILGSSLALRLIEEFAFIFLAGVCLLLLLTVFFGGGPAGRWLILGPL